MAWNSDARRLRLPKDWKARRLAVLERDAWSCRTHTDDVTVCGAFANEVDHMQHGDNHDPSNLQAICRGHHARKSAFEGGQAWAVMRAAEKRPKESHPGWAA